MTLKLALILMAVCMASSVRAATNYTYAATNLPDSSGVHQAILSSGMSDKTVSGVFWDQASFILRVDFTGSPTAGDKTELDGIVTSNLVYAGALGMSIADPSGDAWVLGVDTNGNLTVTIRRELP